jgi:hypothetical protein
MAESGELAAATRVCRTSTVKIACDLLDSAFMFVAAVVRERAPSRSVLSVCSTLAHTSFVYALYLLCRLY